MPQSWRERLIGGPATAANFVYGWRFEEWIHPADINSFCRLAPTDAGLLERVDNDRKKGSQSAEYLYSLTQLCRFGLNGFSSSDAGRSLRQLADQGYEPALVLQALVDLNPIYARKSNGSNRPQAWNLTGEERQVVEQVQARLSQASAQDWPAAHYLLFEGCRVKLFECAEASLPDLLDRAARAGQVDALRSESVYLLAGNGEGDQMRSRTGFSLPQDTAKGLTQLQQLAQPRTGASEIAWASVWDPISSGYLAYFYGGGKYRGQTLVSRDQLKYLTYALQCGNNVPPFTPLFDFCSFIMSFSNFNDSTQSDTMRSGAWGTLTSYGQLQELYYPLSQNLRTWSQDGSNIDRIDCPIAFDLTFTAPPGRPQPQPRTAYCYFSRQELSQ